MLNLPIETEQLARLIGLRSGKSPEAVVSEAVEQHAVLRGLLPTRARRSIDVREVAAIVERAARRPVLDSRSSDEIVDYDDFGLPR